MTNKTYFTNFFYALAASLSDDEFLAFAETVLGNLQQQAHATAAADAATLAPQVAALRAAHTQRGPQGRSAGSATLAQTVRTFLQWARLTNTTKIFPAFPDPRQPERVAIFPGGMDALYRADQGNVLSRARYYLDKISKDYGAQTGIKPAEAEAQYQLLEQALSGRATERAQQRGGSAAIDEAEQAVCLGLYQAYAGLLHAHYQDPAQAYALFPFPKTTGQPEDANLAAVPKPHPAG
ncbi:hypothetical protein [Hymenobacter psychrotolerans]|uniref:Uncharacterized protein n=1 Tax=Hymenobacter psychrotolerans DSM 18569 TaxID=1121959 RepID=A0A1M6Y2U9_9BACT|nr:hypothetical protein [Hymenobacter psychrotolerans]SHL12423.1 hypothetical protein SAMN02746009_02165 [Hymenobacter psychrotolerans DSM 18569]